MRSIVAVSLAGLLAAPLAAQSTTLITATADGNPGNDSTFIPCLTDNGRYLTLTTEATDLLEDGTVGPVVVDLKKGTRTPVMVAYSGTPGDGSGTGWGTSSNGRFAVFESSSTNLVDNDFNGATDVFVHDLKQLRTFRASVTSAGAEAHGASNLARISGNGRCVVFCSSAADLVGGDTLAHIDIFLHDFKTGLTERLSLSTAGAEADADSTRPTVSRNGRWVAFASHAENLVDDDDNGVRDIFVRDRKLGTTTRVSVTEEGEQIAGTLGSYASFLSGSGRFVAMVTDSPELAASDHNDFGDLYLRDLKKGTVTRLSVGPEGADADAGSCISTDTLWVSGNGRWIAFSSEAGNLVETDANGGTQDVFLADRVKGTLTLASLADDGDAANSNASECSVSNSGRRVAFTSGASNLTDTTLPGPPASRDAFLRDLKK